MKDQYQEMGNAFAKLCEIMARLRAPGGCAWDREQDLHSLKPYLLEETHEVLDVLDDLTPGGEGPHAEHRDELGDLLLQIVFQAQIQRESNRFDAGDVANATREKLERRHPHIFDPDYIGPDQPDWETLKQKERADKPQKPQGALSGVPHALPALLRALRVGEKAHRVGFDWPNTDGVLAKIEEELEEVKESLTQSQARFEEEVGDLLYAIVNLCRHRNCDPETALRRCVGKFEKRFGWLEEKMRLEGKDPFTSDLDELEEYWNQAKNALAAQPSA